MIIVLMFFTLLIFQEQAMRGAAGGAGAGGGKNFGNMPNDGIPPERDGYPPVDGKFF